MFAYSKEQLVYVVEYMFHSLGFVDAFGLDEEVIVAFLHALRESYNNVPFHNFYHCFCVTQMAYCVFVAAAGEDESVFLNVFEKFVVFVSALCHDVDHPGFSNSYQINAQTPLAMVYNDMSCLENHHCSQAFALFKQPGCNLLAPFSREQYKELRRLMVKLILVTDLANHSAAKAKFDAAVADGTLDLTARASRDMLCQVVIMACDISNEVRPFAIARPWADRITAEWGNQVAVEKALGLPFLPFMDAETVVVPKSQIGFINDILHPIWTSLMAVVEPVRAFEANILANREAYAVELASLTPAQK